MRNKLATLILLLAVLASAGCTAAAIPSPATPTPGQAIATTVPEPNTPPPDQTAEPVAPTQDVSRHIRGNISDIQPADAAAVESGRLGQVRIEGEKIPGNEYDKAVVTVTQDTVILKQDDNALVSAAFEDLAFGQTVTAEFVGPVMESYPVQARAGKIVILAEMPGN